MEDRRTHKKDEEREEVEEEEVETREPSPVVTRRSNRKLQQQKEVKEEDVEDEPMDVDNAKAESEVGPQDFLDLDQDEVESVASELLVDVVDKSYPVRAEILKRNVEDARNLALNL